MVSSIAAKEVPDLSVVVPCFNEAANLSPLVARLLPVLEGTGKSFELIFVDDGSRDGTLALARSIADTDARIGVLALSRNFGKEIAISSGLDHARGRGVIIIDADLQHPPELVPELIAAWEQGFQVVHAAQSIRPDEPRLKRIGVKAFYWLLDNLSDTKLPKGVGDFCLLDRRAVDALCSLPERARFMKGLYFWIGFRQAQIPYEPQKRNEGSTGWSLAKLLGLALNGLTAFSTIPLRLAAFVGLAVSLVALIYALILITNIVLHGIDVPGYASLMVGLLFLSGVQLISLGILGEYIGRVFNESKQRPLYLIDEYRPPRTEAENKAPLPRLAGE